MVDLKHQIDIKASPLQVYAALATPDGLASWWTAVVQADQKVGGKAEFVFHKRSAVYRMTIVALDPRKQVAWSCQGDNPEWMGTTLTWTITSDGGASYCVSRTAAGSRRPISSQCAIRRGVS